MTQFDYKLEKDGYTDNVKVCVKKNNMIRFGSNKGKYDFYVGIKGSKIVGFDTNICIVMAEYDQSTVEASVSEFISRFISEYKMLSNPFVKKVAQYFADKLKGVSEKYYFEVNEEYKTKNHTIGLSWQNGTFEKDGFYDILPSLMVTIDGSWGFYTSYVNITGVLETAIKNLLKNNK